MRVGGIDAEVVVSDPQPGFADPLRADHRGVADCEREIVQVVVPAPVAGDQRTEAGILAVQSRPIAPQEEFVRRPYGVVDSGYELLPFLRERKHPAVAFEQTNHMGIVSRNQGLRKVPDQRSQRRKCGWSRVAGDPVGQSLLRGRQFVQKRLVTEQRNERRLVAVEAFVGGVEKRRSPQDGTAEGPPALSPGVG